jgi:hypothetical protein
MPLQKKLRISFLLLPFLVFGQDSNLIPSPLGDTGKKLDRLYLQSKTATQDLQAQMPCKSQSCKSKVSEIERLLKSLTLFRESSDATAKRFKEEHRVLASIRIQSLQLLEETALDYPIYAKDILMILNSQSKSCSIASPLVSSLATQELRKADGAAPVSECGGFAHNMCNLVCYGAAIAGAAGCIALPPPLNGVCAYGVYIAEVGCMGGCFAANCQ